MEIIIIALASFCFGIITGKLYEKEKHKPKVIKIDKRIKQIDNSKKINDIHTFEYFWSEFFRINPGRKLDKQHCKDLWHKCYFDYRKKKAIADIKRTDLSALEYLKIKLLKP